MRGGHRSRASRVGARALNDRAGIGEARFHIVFGQLGVGCEAVGEVGILAKVGKHTLNGEVMMSDCGRITIPSAIREAVHLDDNAQRQRDIVDDQLVITPAITIARSIVNDHKDRYNHVVVHRSSFR
ncbi:MAG: hypothetical protein LC793_03000 [Thermomicrobia bacterium]|nr:hypothetical protein [Thermomicrobia bacterium]